LLIHQGWHPLKTVRTYYVKYRLAKITRAGLLLLSLATNVIAAQDKQVGPNTPFWGFIQCVRLCLIEDILVTSVHVASHL